MLKESQSFKAYSNEEIPLLGSVPIRHNVSTNLFILQVTLGIIVFQLICNKDLMLHYCVNTNFTV